MKRFSIMLILLLPMCIAMGQKTSVERSRVPIYINTGVGMGASNYYDAGVSPLRYHGLGLGGDMGVTVDWCRFQANIDSNAFNNCSGLNNIFVNSTIPPAVYSSYSFSNYSATLWVPCGYSETYASETVWDNFSDIRESRTNLLNVESSNLQKGTVKITQHPFPMYSLPMATA